MTDLTPTAGPSITEGPAVPLCTKCKQNPRARKNASWCRDCYNEAAADYRLRARPRVVTEQRECAWGDCDTSFIWRSSHPKQVCCSKSHYMQLRYWSVRPVATSESMAEGWKRCSKCKTIGTADDFASSQWRDGVGGGQCRRCWRAYTNEWQRQNKERRSATSRKWRAARLLRQYQAPTDDIDVLIAGQNSRCASCGGLPGAKGFQIDHDHETNLYRGLLCSGCNLAIGGFRDDVDRMARAITYVLRARGVEIDSSRLMSAVHSATTRDDVTREHPNRGE